MVGDIVRGDVCYNCLFFCFNNTPTTEIYTYRHTLPYTTHFRSEPKARDPRPTRPSHSTRRTVLSTPEPSCATLPLSRIVKGDNPRRSEEHTSELQSLMRLS